MSPFKFIGGLLTILILAYFGYAFWQASGAPKTVDIRSRTSLQSLPPTTCMLRNDISSVTGNLFLFRDAARFDITSNVNNNQKISVHILMSHTDGLAYLWQDGIKDGQTTTYASVYASVGLDAITHVDCKPWWFPVGSYFIPPLDVTFPKSI